MLECGSGHEHLTTDGVAVFQVEGPVPFSAGLVFGVGRRDESFVKGGPDHLVEHLVMRPWGRRGWSATPRSMSMSPCAKAMRTSGATRARARRARRSGWL